MGPKRTNVESTEKKPPKVSKSKKSKDEDGDDEDGDKIVEATPVVEADLSSSATTKDGKPWNTKIVSMNVNGFRAWMKKGGVDYITKESADIFCVQETKCPSKEIPYAELEKAGFSAHFLSGDKAGYSGVGIIYKKKPVNIVEGINVEKHDNEGRVITAEYEDFYLVTVYVPNSQRGLKRLDYRTKEWDTDFREYLKGLDAKKPVIVCGDLNVAHEEIDLKNPKSNKNKTPGFCDGERAGLGELLKAGFTDTFRFLYPTQTDSYTFWTYLGNARANNVGWRLDYFLISNRFQDKLCDSVMRTKVMGSDHCPIALFMAL